MPETARPLVSIGISTYNRADGYLKEALGGAVAQTYPDLEIIVSDNCSDDDTEGVVRSFDDPRIRYIRQERNIGANGNFNFCLEQARGAYFLLLHDDDRIDPDFVETLMDAARDRTDFGLLRTGVRTIDDEGNVLKESPNRAQGLSAVEFLRAWFRWETPLYLCNTLYNTEGLKAAGGFASKHNLFDDVVATVRLAARYPRVDVLEPKASFRRHGENAGAAAAVTRWCEDSLHVMDVICRELPEAADALRREGLAFFAHKNYRHVERIPSAAERVRMYWYVYGQTERAYSPARFLYPKLVRKPMRRVGRAVRSGLGIA